MASFNKVILLGNLTRDPQLSYLPSQTPVCEFGLAINHRWRGPNGEQKEEVCFIDCRVYGKQAETFNQSMAKGRPVLIEGRLQLDQWEDKEGQKRSRHRVLVDRFQFVGSPGQGGAPRPAQNQANRQPPSSPPPAPPAEDDNRPPEDQPSGEEIPF